MKNSCFVMSILLASKCLFADVLVDPLVSYSSFGPTLCFSEVSYENEDDNEFSMKRDTLGLNAQVKSSALTVLLQAGYIMDSEFKDSELNNGNGYSVGLGLAVAAYRSSRSSLSVYALLDHTDEEFKIYWHRTIDMYVTDVHVGTQLLFMVAPRVGIFGGVDFVPYSKGSLDYKDRELEVKRKDRLNLQIGMEFVLPSVTIKPELTFPRDNTITVVAAFKL